jgi:hypothetical protein
VPASDALPILRGPDPELRDPARFALLEAYPDKAELQALGAILQQVIPVRLADLEPQAFAEVVAPDPEHLLGDYIEVADRSWRLGELLRRAHEDRPGARKLATVHRAWQRWDEAVRRALESRPGLDPIIRRRAVPA